MHQRTPAAGLRRLPTMLLVRRFPAFLLVPLLLAGCGGGEPRAGDWSGRELPDPLPRPDFTLTDTGGRPYDFRAETGGKLTLLFFGYTHCPDVCPVHMANIAAVRGDLPTDVVRSMEVVFVTTDPERDTPERLREWLNGFDPSFVGLRGSREEVNAIERSLGLPPSVVDTVEAEGGGEEGFVGHAAQVLAFQPDDTARMAYPWGTRQRDWRRDLPRLARED